MEKIKKTIDHNRYLAIALAVGLVTCVVFASCQPKVRSVLNPETTVTAEELQREAIQIETDFEAKIQQLEIARAELQRKAELRVRIVGIIGTLSQAAASGAVNPTTGIAAVLQLLTLTVAGGAIADNRRKDKIIKKRKPA